MIVSVPTIPYASWPGRWQMYCSVPGWAKVSVVWTLLYICHLPGHEAYGMVGTLTIT